MRLTLHIWRQVSASASGGFKTYIRDHVSPNSSFLEMLDELNVSLEKRGESPIHFDHDCREGICGACGLYINGQPHGPLQTTTCQLHMRSFRDGSTVWVEPWRARAFPVIKDLVVDRGAFDRILQKGGYISVNTGGVPDANALPIPKGLAEESMTAASCIGCGACVAACKNASAMLFVSAKLVHLNTLPQGQVEQAKRTQRMVEQMDKEGFGACTNTGACAAACPKEIPLQSIASMNKYYLKSTLKGGDTS